MGRKPVACEGLVYLLNKGVDVSVVVAPPSTQPVHWRPRLVEVAAQFGIPTASDEELYKCLTQPGGASKLAYQLENIDLVISFLFWKRIRKPLITLAKIGCINFHPAPLPEFRGLGGYNIAIYENISTWGGSAHFVDESFDTGDLIKVHRFEIDPSRETAFSLDQKTQQILLMLFKEVADIALDTGTLPRTPQGEGRYVTRQEYDNLRKIRPDDTIEEIERKIRAFWYPPYPGATVQVLGKKFTLVTEELLNEIGEKYHVGTSPYTTG